MIAGDRVSVTVVVDADQRTTFDVFWRDIDLWWKRGVAYRASGRSKTPGVLTLEPRVGGRLFEEYDAGARVHEAGRVITWDPPAQLAFEWRGVNFAPGEVTVVEVRFSPTESGKTEVALIHRGFAALRPDHPVRHGKPVPEFIRDFGLWWGALMRALREHVVADRP